MKKISKFNLILSGCIIAFITCLLPLINIKQQILEIVYILSIIFEFTLVITGIIKKDKNKEIKNKTKIIITVSILLFCIELFKNIILLFGDKYITLSLIITKTILVPTTLLSFIVFSYGMIISKKTANNKKSLWTTILVISIYGIASTIVEIYRDMWQIFTGLAIIIVLLIPTIISIIKITNQPKLVKYNKLIIRVIITTITILGSAILNSYTLINSIIILLTTIAILVTIWCNIKFNQYTIFISLISGLILILLSINYFVIEPRVNSIYYLNYKYGIEKDELNIEKIDFICGDEAMMFPSNDPCIKLYISYKDSEIKLLKDKENSEWTELIFKGFQEVKLKVTDEYINENNQD